MHIGHGLKNLAISLLLYDFLPNLIIFISKYIINASKIITPINPKFEANTANIKSVCISGKYSGVLLKPCPNNPPDPIAVNPLVNCNPLELDQLSILSIR